MDYRELARRRLPRFLFEYIDGGSCAEVTLRRNVSDLEAIALRQRVMRDVSVLDLTTELFGTLQAMPLARTRGAARCRQRAQQSGPGYRSAFRPYRPVRWQK
jgi:isopentenyl diphosphate isomerase/L-lactate dehydrogenase-like FMN-dependent dehydrogenase